MGLVLAMAGNAIGLGNFLRFPGNVASNGGGAFMIPYFISFVLMGIPLMWLEWAQGRYGGARGYGTTPGMFHVMWPRPLAKYLGVLGLFVPTVIMVYYTYIESWCLGYSVLSLVGHFFGSGFPTVEPGVLPSEVVGRFEAFREGYLGRPIGDFIQVSSTAYLFFLLTLGLNVWIVARGVAAGIEAMAKVAMPLLFFFAVVLAVRVYTLGSPVNPQWTPMDGVRFLWEPQWDKLSDWSIWLAAAGQIFFTLSLGMGAIQCYASYLGKDDDVMLTGLSTTSANEFAEVILGGSIAIPAAATFFGLTQAVRIAGESIFFLGFTSMSAIFSYLPAGSLLGGIWFLMLFFAGFTSSVAMMQPMMAFVQEEFGFSRKKAALCLGLFYLASTQICIFLRDSLDVLDFWAGTFGPVTFALVEVVLMMWLFGGEKMWAEMHRGAQLKAPRFFYLATKFITPVLLATFLVGRLFQHFTELTPGQTLEGVPPGWTVWLTRAYLVVLLVGLCATVWRASKRQRERWQP
jgi:SNF family Na+-dependent transporter